MTNFILFKVLLVITTSGNSAQPQEECTPVVNNVCKTEHKPVVTTEYKQQCRTIYGLRCHEVNYVMARDCHVRHREECSVGFWA